MSNDNRISMTVEPSIMPETNDKEMSMEFTRARVALLNIEDRWQVLSEDLGREISALRAEVRRLQEEGKQVRAERDEARDIVLHNGRAALTGPPRLTRPNEHVAALAAVSAERERQEGLWGPQDDHEFGCEPSHLNALREEEIRFRYAEAVKHQALTWMLILDEEVAELRNSNSHEDIYKEAIQVSAVALAIAEQAKRRIK